MNIETLKGCKNIQYAWLVDGTPRFVIDNGRLSNASEAEMLDEIERNTGIRPVKVDWGLETLTIAGVTTVFRPSEAWMWQYTYPGGEYVKFADLIDLLLQVCKQDESNVCNRYVSFCKSEGCGCLMP